MSTTAHDSHHEHHVIPPATYYVIIGILMVLLLVTWLAAQWDFGWLNIPIALGIAGTKMVLIMVYFMHLKFMTPLVRMFAAAGFVWLAIGGLLLFSDYLTRGWHSGRTLKDVYDIPAALDRVAPGAEDGFSIHPPGATAENSADSDND